MKTKKEIRQMLFDKLKYYQTEIEKLYTYEKGLPDVKEENKELHLMYCTIKEQLEYITYDIGLTEQCCACGEIISLLDEHDMKKGGDETYMHSWCFNSEFAYELGS